MSLELSRTIHSRFGWTARVRPMVVGAFLADLLAPNRRTVISTEHGMLFYADPLSNFGEELVRNGIYEPETGAILNRHLKTGDSFLDIGANEGYFSILAKRIVESGTVVAIEPQSELCNLIRRNAMLNSVQVEVIHGALGGEPGTDCVLNLYPSLNTGAASIVRRPKLFRRKEVCQFVDPALLNRRWDLVKVDVEGFEHKVVESLVPLMKSGKIRTLLVDFHLSILAANGVDPDSIELAIRNNCGMHRISSATETGYRLYQSEFPCT